MIEKGMPPDISASPDPNHKYYENPPYTWPNPAFPFRVYVDTPQLRVFLIECVPHNWNWLKRYHRNFQDRDVFLVTSGWWAGALAGSTREVFAALGLDKRQFYMLCNSPEEIEIFEGLGLNCVFVNNNAFIDETLYTKVDPNVAKIYDAIYVGRRTAFKRHILAQKVDRLAIVAGNNHGNNLAPIPDTTVYINDKPLTPEEVGEKIRQSHCGLIFSEWEGACFASSEYLLCGVPVVSTYCKGGREVFYTDENAIFCDPDPDAIRDAAEVFKQTPRDPYALRASHIEKAKMFRQNFIALLQELSDSYSAGLDAQQYFTNNFFDNMKNSIQVDFDALFGSTVASQVTSDHV